MGVIATAIVFAGGIFAAAISRIVADDIREWASWATERLIRRALRKLPARFQQRYDEEWRSHLDEVPGTTAKLFVAFGYVRAANAICALTKRHGSWGKKALIYFFVRIFLIGWGRLDRANARISFLFRSALRRSRAAETPMQYFTRRLSNHDIRIIAKRAAVIVTREVTEKEGKK